jgi:hypothetical protein
LKKIAKKSPRSDILSQKWAGFNTGIEMEDVVKEGRARYAQVKKTDQINAKEKPLENVHVGYKQMVDVDGGLSVKTPSKDCDFLQASPANRITLTGGRRRAKRKLSLTRRIGKRTKLSFSSPTTNNPSLPVPVINSSSPLAAVAQSSSLPKVVRSDSPQASSAPLAAVICSPAPQVVMCPPPSQAGKVCSPDLSSSDTCPPTAKVTVMSPPTGSICPHPPSHQMTASPPLAVTPSLAWPSCCQRSPSWHSPRRKEECLSVLD